MRYRTNGTIKPALRDFPLALADYISETLIGEDRRQSLAVKLYLALSSEQRAEVIEHLGNASEGFAP